MSEQLPDPTFIPGLTLRDWFAGMALQGLLASDKKLHITDACSQAYELADLMLEARDADDQIL